MKFLSFLCVVFIGVSAVAQRPAFDAEAMWQLKRVGSDVVSPDGNKIIYRASSYNFANGVDNPTSTSVFKIIHTDKKNETTLLPNSGDIIGNLTWMNNSEIIFLAKEKGMLQIVRQNVDGTNRKSLTPKGCAHIEEFVVSPNGNYIVALQTVKVTKDVKDNHPDLTKSNTFDYVD